MTPGNVISLIGLGLALAGAIWVGARQTTEMQAAIERLEEQNATLLKNVEAVREQAGNAGDLASANQRSISSLEASDGKINAFAGAVVAFDVREGCPDGWDPVPALDGKVIVGASEGDGLRNRPYGLPGGSHQVTLTPAQVAPHVHPPAVGRQYIWKDRRNATNEPLDGNLIWNFVYEPEKRGGWFDHGGELDMTGLSTGGEPFDNMPPYLALFWCKPGSVAD